MEKPFITLMDCTAGYNSNKQGLLHTLHAAGYTAYVVYLRISISDRHIFVVANRLFPDQATLIDNNHELAYRVMVYAKDNDGNTVL